MATLWTVLFGLFIKESIININTCYFISFYSDETNIGFK